MIISLQDCLSSVIDNRGVTPHKRGTEWQDEGVPVISANNVKTSGLQKVDEIRYVPEKAYDSWMKEPLEIGDILLTSEAPAGEVLYWDKPWRVILGQRLYGLKVKPEINSLFLKYYLQSAVGQKAIASQQSGSTVFGISAATFKNIMLDLPDKKYQDSYSKILYDIDKKIENNNAIISELESMAKDIYDYWFVQFDFPDENGKPYRSSGGKMIWNEELKREIPVGWKAETLGDISEVITKGTTPTTVGEGFCNEGINFIRVENIQNGSIDLTSVQHISENANEKLKRSKLAEGDILISIAGRLGSLQK